MYIDLCYTADYDVYVRHKTSLQTTKLNHSSSNANSHRHSSRVSAAGDRGTS